MSTKRMVLTLMLAGIIAVPAISSRAQTAKSTGNEQRAIEIASQDELREALALIRDARGQRLEGSWAVTVTPVLPPGAPPPPPFHVYATFSRGGALIGSDRTIPFGSPQHGTWAHIGGDEFAFTLIQDLFDAKGDFQGTVKVRVTKIRITGKDEFVGVSSGELRDANGNLVRLGCGTIRGERITVEPLPPQCEGIVPPQ